MTRAAAILALLLALLLAVERRLATADRANAGRAGHLLTAEERAGAAIAVVRVETPRGERFVYARGPGGWRLVDRPGLCDQAALDGLVRLLLDLEGIVVSTRTADAATYGVTSAEAIRVFLCGPRALRDPAGDVRFAFDVGRAVPERHSAFVRRRGQRAIWSVAADPRTPLVTRVAPHLAPLLDARVVPADWPGRREGLLRLTVTDAGGRFVLERRPRTPSPEDLRAGALPWSWVLTSDSGAGPADERAAEAFARAVLELRWSDVLPEAADFQAAARLTLEGRDGARTTLEIGPPEEEGCRVRTAGAVYRLEPGARAALLPSADALVPEGR